MKQVAEDIQGYSYGSPDVAQSAVSVREFDDLKTSAGFTEDDQRYLLLAGEVLADQTKQIVGHWRSEVIASIPNLARHSRAPDGAPMPDYLAKSNLRFQQWILDTCLRPYDQDWINYQQEIALRHTAVKKNTVDGVQSTPYVPLRDVMTFVAVMNMTMKRYLGAKGHPGEVVDKMHQAWCKSIQIQLALWVGPYADNRHAPTEW